MSTSTLSNPVVDVSDLQFGEYVFKVTVTDNTGASTSATMKLTVQDGSASGLTDEFTVFPNPAHNEINGKIISSITGTVKVVIYDMNGRLVLVSRVEKSDNSVTKTMYIDRLSPGMYTIQITIANRKTMTTKFIKY